MPPRQCRRRGDSTCAALREQATNGIVFHVRDIDAVDGKQRLWWQLCVLAEEGRRRNPALEAPGKEIRHAHILVVVLRAPMSPSGVDRSPTLDHAHIAATLAGLCDGVAKALRRRQVTRVGTSDAPGSSLSTPIFFSSAICARSIGPNEYGDQESGSIQAGCKTGPTQAV